MGLPHLEMSHLKGRRPESPQRKIIKWIGPHSWMEVGDASIGGGGGTGVVESGISLCLVLLCFPDCSFTVLWLSLAFVTDPFPLFQGCIY